MSCRHSQEASVCQGRRAFVETFVKEIVVMPGKAVTQYTIPISQSTQKLSYSWAVDLKSSR